MIHLHVACWIIPLLQVASIGVVGRIPIGGFAVKDRDNNYWIGDLILIMWYQITGLLTAKFC